MSCKVYLRSSTATPTFGTDETRLATPAFGTALAANAITYSRGTVAGPTAPLQFTNGAGGTAMTWITPPLAWGVTISGTVTINIRAKVDAAAANATVEMKVLRLNSSAVTQSTVVAVPPGTIPASLTTSDAILTYTVTPTSTTFNAGDIIGIQIYIDDAVAVNMATGHTVTISIDASSGSAGAGDTWVQFTENVGFKFSGGVDRKSVPPNDIPINQAISGHQWGPSLDNKYRMRGIVSGSPVYWNSLKDDVNAEDYQGGGGTPTNIVCVAPVKIS